MLKNLVEILDWAIYKPHGYIREDQRPLFFKLGNLYYNVPHPCFHSQKMTIDILIYSGYVKTMTILL